MQPMNSKITEQHRSRPAYIYIRQSTNAQVLHHQESTERQYALRTMALELGWSESAIRTLDRDLGMTGTEMTRREDFKTLVADVSMGQVGAVFALEVSRLSRSNLDWHRLLELCALIRLLWASRLTLALGVCLHCPDRMAASVYAAGVRAARWPESSGSHSTPGRGWGSGAGHCPHGPHLCADG
jgi:hypothetical protein